MIETPVSSPAAEFSAAQAVAAGTDFAELKVSADGLFWNEFRPADGACRIWHWLHYQARCLTPDGFSVRSRVYEYGGGSFCLGGDGLVFVNEKDQQVYTQPLDDSLPRALTQDASCRYGDVQWHNGQVLAVEERHAEQVEHRLVALGDSSREVLAEGADFYASPAVSADGQRLAWIEWDRPAQPWTVTRLMYRARDASGHWGPTQCVAAAEESLQQPRFDAEGRLYCLSDRNGFWQPWGEVDGQWQALPAAPADHAAAPWQLGTCTWLALGPQSYLASWFEDGFGQLGLRGEDGRMERFASAYTRFRSLAMDSEHLYAIAASPISPRQSLPLTAATMKYACWPVVPKCCRQGKSACRSRSTTTVAASRPMVSSTRQRSRKAPHRWWCSSTAGQPQPVIPCSTRVSSIGPSAALPWPTSTTGAAPAMVGNTARHCTSAGARAMWPMPAR